jgi:hypothetical protein
MAPKTTVNGNRVTITTQEGDDVRLAQTQAGTNPINSLTLTQALAYLQSNVTDLPSARVYLAHLTKLVFIQERRIARLEKVLKDKGI